MGNYTYTRGPLLPGIVHTCTVLLVKWDNYTGEYRVQDKQGKAVIHLEDHQLIGHVITIHAHYVTAFSMYIHHIAIWSIPCI